MYIMANRYTSKRESTPPPDPLAGFLGEVRESEANVREQWDPTKFGGKSTPLKTALRPRVQKGAVE